MRRTATVLTGISLAGFLVASPAAAQRGPGWRGAGGWGPATAYGRLYDVKTVETTRGEILAVEHFTPEKGMSAGLRLQLKTDKGVLPVHLGPEWYIERQDIELKVKDVVEVKGSRITFEGKPAIVAAEVRRGDEVLTLRDPSGFPAWSGWRRR
jgi:hypothetical protein